LRLANLALRTGRIADGRRYADLARGAADETEQPRAVLMSGRVATAEGKFADAERQLRDVLKKTKSEQTVWETHARLAQLFVKTGNAAKADADFRQAVDSARGIRDSIHDPELRFSFFTAVAELFDSYVDFLVAQNRIEDALSVTEASRAQSLGEVRPREKQRDVRTIARDTRATILCYWLGAEHSYLWVVTPKKVDLVRLAPKREIEYAINGYQADLVVARASLKTSGARGIALWRMLVEPASRAIAPGAHVIVIPSGSLHAFNMETLVVPSPHPHYWIEDAVISTAGSLRLLANGAAKPSAAPRLLLVGNAPPPSKSFRALTHAADEMARVKRYFDRSAVVLEGPRATPSAYRASSPESFTFLHFVAHGVATRQKPLDSAIVLAAEGETFKLYAREIAKETLNARLVTISSCRGAGTRAYAGEGLVGLGWAFLHAGADNVIAALWDVDDSATPELMDRMYAGIRAGRDPAVALRDAKLALVRTAGPFQQPSYWAPFVLYSGS
ncbi:MAG TPA: CHAT domain-containing protein, partial [Thermoanaerobaculia bacterium]|nr:CHAT domain-containing protein [Thermoanaerobaculia bacterium]